MRVTGRAILTATANHYDISHGEIIGSARFRRVCRPRQVAMYLIRKHCPHMSYPRIGELFGGRDHTTAMHSERAIIRLMETNPDIAKDIKIIEAKIYEPNRAGGHCYRETNQDLGQLVAAL